MNVLDIKATVRARDGHRCTLCGLTNEEHLAAFGKQLHVHRIVPRSIYTPSGCYTVCFRCHTKLPKAPRGTPDPHRPGSVTFRLPLEMHTRLEAAADGLGTDASHLLRMLIRESLPLYERRVKDIQQREGNAP